MLSHVDPVVAEQPDAAAPALAIEVQHSEGFYAPGGWLVCSCDMVWNDPSTSILVDGEERFRIVGECYNVRTYRIRHGRKVEEIAPAVATHYAAAHAILELIGAPEPIWETLQNVHIYVDELDLAS